MQKINHEDMRRIISTLPKDVIALMKDHPIYLAGGFIRARIAGEVVSDIDLLTTRPENAEIYASALGGSRQCKVYRTKNAHTVLAANHTPVQFIKRWTFDTPEALIESFDFTVAQVCIWFEDGAWHSLADDDFYRDLAAKRLRYRSPLRHEDAGGSILRVQKFLKRGYDISPEDFGKVIARLINRIEPDSNFWNEGEPKKAKVITGLLRHVDPLTIIDGLEPSNSSLEEAPVPEQIA